MNHALAIIPARGGSKRIPRKNIKHFFDKPIMAYSIEAAIKSGCFENVMVSTDDSEIAEIAKTYGAEVPFMRSEKNSSDHASTADVLLEVLQSYQKLGKIFSSLCCIYPAAVFASAEKIRESKNILESNPQVQTVFPIVKFSFPIQRAVRLKSGWLEPVNAEDYKKRSQDLEPSYHDAGQYYWLKVSSFEKTGTILGDKCLGIPTSEMEVQDIDNSTDWQLAEMKYQLLKDKAA